MSGWVRDRALLTVTSPLGANVLMAVSLSGHEEISQPYDFRLSMVSPRSDIAPDDLLHKELTVAIQHDGQPIRYFHGFVQSFATDGKVDGRDLTRYQARIVPGLWFLGQTVDCRIFQQQSVSDIVRAIVQEAGLPAPIMRLASPQKPREYIAQYNETDLQFISRLLQEEGAFYFFEHRDGGHDFVVADHNGAFKPVPGGTLRFDSAVPSDDVLTGWHRAMGTTHGKTRLTDYDPETPSKKLDGEQETVLRAAGASVRDTYHWPALSHDPARVRAMARFRLEADEASVSLIQGEGRNRDFIPGTTFTLAESPHDGQKNKKFALHAVSHEAWDHTILNADGDTGYTNHFNVFPNEVPWREHFSIPRPRMDGVHAALVIGPSGEEIHTDDLGRVKVLFFWDHRKDSHPGNSIWARVVYPWAGNGWGWQSTPRIGTEVIVAFLDGDVDRPIVLGGVYNGQDAPIYTKADKTKSGIRTRSSLKGYGIRTFDSALIAAAIAKPAAIVSN